MKSINDSLQRTVTYQEYRDLVVSLLKEGKSTGHVQSLELTHYSKLNNSRMRRLDKTFKMSDNAKFALDSLNEKYIWLVITEGWCGDAAQILPVINRIAEASENIELKIVLRDENETLMNQFLTNGGKAIPKLIMLEADSLGFIKSWGPRPTMATKMVVEEKERNGKLDAAFKEKLQNWYNSTKGMDIESDLLDLLGVSQFA